MNRRVRAGVVVAVACVAAAHAQQPTRDVSLVARASASISGTVVLGGDAKKPARRVRVTLTELSGSASGQTTTTDDNGVFTFRGLRAGRFELQAFKDAYLRASYGALRPSHPGTPIVVKDGETVTDLSMTIFRGGVIAGFVLDARGRPMPGLIVRVLKLGYDDVTGEVTLMSPNARAVFTDDRGEYRAFGLPPGGYFVLVPPPSTSGRSNDPIRQLTSDEIRQVSQAARTGASTDAPMSRGSLTSVAPRVNYAPVFYPNATDIRAAATITLGVSEERTGVDVTIEPVPTATISGTVTAPGGALPPFLGVRLVPAGAQLHMLAGAEARGASAQSAPDGRFVFTSVAPGTYTIKAWVGSGRGASPNVPTLWAAEDVNVSGQDLDVSLALQPGGVINGHVVFEGTQPTPAELQSLSLGLVSAGSGGAIQPYAGGRVDSEGRFSFSGIAPDSYQFVTTWNNQGARDKWSIKSSFANGRESLESPLQVNVNETLDWVVTFTDKPTGLLGALHDSDGRPATDYYILVFSSNRRYWTPGSKRVRMTRPATDGSYNVKGLPSGEYYLATLTDLDTGEWHDPGLFEQLVPSSATVTLNEGEMTRKDFRIRGK